MGFGKELIVPVASTGLPTLEGPSASQPAGTGLCCQRHCTANLLQAAWYQNGDSAGQDSSHPQAFLQPGSHQLAVKATQRKETTKGSDEAVCFVKTVEVFTEKDVVKKSDSKPQLKVFATRAAVVAHQVKPLHACRHPTQVPI